MFRGVLQRNFVRFNSHGHGHGHVSKLINEPAFQPNKEVGDAFKKAYEHKRDHSEPVTLLWKKITYWVALPAIIITAIPVIRTEIKHAHHREHTKHLSDEEWPTQYEYQNLRQKKFFWGDGDKTLFWNSDVNRHIEA
ncbi:hypothetical protein HYPBUDRAFT_101552 [Hyphopichia burtonii NRRL Y-1933]|uniref:Cytochrome c oxidase subunit n=1 Tax=Hyphopichia burtonii NRRL Y-1933 TaxID=984485 RepID=A0A1E4RQ50_9ASCO|nr:hypothetical protein HYPBUDRAFT_101552 [Hyphopichia burtonii NRRL Y-1933]ODV69331.1 hypothetical protein HYPBUDRAFT_101552 [Hyphopichia burtonii NRRL Y-1933]